MIEIHENLFVGTELDYEQTVKDQDGWCAVQACRDPYHRSALGYKGQGAPKGRPEYLVARRDQRLILNLLDAASPAYVPNEIIDAALAFIKESQEQGHRVLVHCNQGQSRAPAIGLLYLASTTNLFYGMDYSEAHDRFCEVYAPFKPFTGIHGFLIRNWPIYCRGHSHEEPTAENG